MFLWSTTELEIWQYIVHQPTSHPSIYASRVKGAALTGPSNLQFFFPIIPIPLAGIVPPKFVCLGVSMGVWKGKPGGCSVRVLLAVIVVEFLIMVTGPSSLDRNKLD